MEPLNSCNFSLYRVIKKGRNIFRPFLYVCLCWPIYSFAIEQNIFVDVSSFSANESTSIYSISGNWNEGVDSGDEAVSVNRMLFGYKQSNFKLALIKRQDIYYRYSNALADLLYLTENQVNLPQGKVYPLYIDVNKASSSGIWFEYLWKPDENWTIQPSISLLKTHSIQAGSLKGQAVSVAASDYDFNFFSDLVYDTDPLYERETDGLSGDGYSFDLNLIFDSGNRWALELSLLDISGQLNIPDAPYTNAQATSDTKRYDENGYVIYDPVIKGREGFKDFVYQFKMQTHLNLHYLINDQNGISLQYHDLQGFTYQQFEWIRYLDNSDVSLQFIPNLQALGIAYHSKNLKLSFITDHYDYQKMKVLGLEIMYGYEF